MKTIKRKRAVRKKKGGGTRKKTIQLLVQKKHTSPNLDTTIRVYPKPSVPSSFIDFGSFYQLFDYYFKDVEEDIAVQKYGETKPPKKLKIINVLVDDEQIPIFDYPQRTIKSCKHTTNKKDDTQKPTIINKQQEETKKKIKKNKTN